MSFLRTQESPTRLAVTGFAPTGRSPLLSHVVTGISPRWGVSEIRAIGWHAFQSMANVTFFYPLRRGAQVLKEMAFLRSLQK